MRKLYFTCPAEWRGTQQEQDAELALIVQFPEHRISGPHQKNRESAIRRAHPAFSDPNRFFDYARISADFCVALFGADGKIPVDVFDDMDWFLRHGIPVYGMAPGTALTRCTHHPYYKQTLTLQETQARLTEEVTS